MSEQEIEVKRLAPDAWRIFYRGLHLTLPAQAMRELTDELLKIADQFSEEPPDMVREMYERLDHNLLTKREDGTVGDEEDEDEA